jgi:hypothetical protein
MPVESGLCLSAYLPESVSPLTQLRGFEDSLFLNLDPGSSPTDMKNLLCGFGSPAHTGEFKLIHSGTIQFPASGSMHTYLGRLKRALRRIGFRDDYESNYRRQDFYSDNPYAVLSLINATAGTISNRVHTCAAALAFGKKVRYVKSTPRSSDGRFALLASFGAYEIDKRSVQLDSANFRQRKRQLGERLVAILDPVA